MLGVDVRLWDDVRESERSFPLLAQRTREKWGTSCPTIAYMCASNWNAVPPGGTMAVSGSDVLAVKPTGNFAFVMNVGKLEQASFALAPGHELRRANSEETSVIQGKVRQLASNSEFMVMPWEQGYDQSGRSVRLPKEEWRYFVIAFEGTNQTVAGLEEAFTLAPLELKIAFTIVEQGAALLMHAERLFLQFEEARWGHLQFLSVGEPDVSEIVEIYGQLQRHAHPSIDIRRFTRELLQLDGIPRRSPLLFLGYFSLLESLLTHQPDPKDPMDSITRQVKSKVALLERRFKYPIDYGPFGGANSETVWTRMYDYRSRLAHGDVPDFDGKLAVLQSHPDALRLVKQTVRAVLRQALVEPQLLADLRSC